MTRWGRGLLILGITIISGLGICSAEETQSSESTNQLLENTSIGVGSVSLEDILSIRVSVASLFEDRPVDVGSAVSVITAKEWHKLGARRPMDPLRVFPGVVINETCCGTEVVSVRGFNQGSRGVAVLVDGIPMNTFSSQHAATISSNSSLGAYDRIEMIRGSGSTIYGADAFRGVLSFLTPKFEKNHLSSFAKYGVFHSYLGNIEASRKFFDLIRGTIILGVQGQGNEKLQYKYTDYNKDETTDSYLKRHFNGQTVVTKLNVKKAEFELFLNHFKSSGFFGNQATANFRNGSQAGKSALAYAGKISNTFSLPGDIELEVRGYYWQQNDVNLFGTTPGVSEEDSTKSVLSSTTNAKTRVQTFVLRPSQVYQGTLENRKGVWVFAKRAAKGIPVKWVVGYNYDYFNILESYQTNRGQSQMWLASNGQKTHYNAAFAQTDTGVFNDKLHFLLGTRYDVYPNFGGQLSPRAGVIFHPHEDSAIKLLYGTGFRAPSAVEKAGSANTAGDPSIKPETIRTYELVYMNQTKNWNIEAGSHLTYWFNTISAVSDSTLRAPLTKRFVNSDKNRGYGFELKGGYMLLENLKVDASGAYIRTIALNPDRSEYYFYPKYVFNWGAAYEIPKLNLDFRLINYHRFVQRTEQSVVTTSKTINETVKLPAYFRTDLHAGWKLPINPVRGKYELTLDIRNLFNRKNKTPSTGGLEGGIPEAEISGLLGVQAQI